MNTSSHVVISLALLAPQGGPISSLAIICGALVPDLPSGALYLCRRLRYGERADRIWNVAYPKLEWLFDLSHSIPLQLAILGLGSSLGLHSIRLFALSSVLHLFVDFPLHGRDAHAHFVPFSHFRFRSPLSYWEKERHGTIGGDLELAATALASRLQCGIEFLAACSTV